MTMHSVYLKEHENPNGSSSGPGSWWTGLGAQPAGAYGESVCQLKSSCMEQQQPSFKDQERVEKGNTTHQFTIFPGKFLYFSSMLSLYSIKKEIYIYTH